MELMWDLLPVEVMAAAKETQKAALKDNEKALYWVQLTVYQKVDQMVAWSVVVKVDTTVEM